MKKGFTIVEVLAVIVIITLITLMIIPNIMNSVNNKKKDISETAKKMIYDAADIYVKENISSYPLGENAIYCIKLESLVNSGKISNPVKDIKTNKEIPLNYYVKTTFNQYNEYVYNLVDNKSCVPVIAYYVSEQNKYANEKTITINYPQSNYTKKYKVLSGSTKENITLNTEQVVTDNPTITFTTNGSIKFWIESNGQVFSDTTVNINKIDVTSPTLALAKETYINVPFDSSWTYTNASVDSAGVLTVGVDTTASASASSDYIDVNGGFYYMVFDGYATNAATQYTPNGGVYWGIYYFDSGKAAAEALNGNVKDGYAHSLTLNAWSNDIYWKTLNTWRSYNRYGSNIKYIQIKFETSTTNEWSQAPIKIRNLKVYGEAIPNSFYLINATANDTESKIKNIKYARGDKDAEYFRNGGETVNNNQISVTENGTYSVCATDNAGNMTIEKINITNIN